MGKIFYILGKSSSGKDTIFQQIKNNRQLNLKTVNAANNKAVWRYF